VDEAADEATLVERLKQIASKEAPARISAGAPRTTLSGLVY
jgi:hypothetical protein